MEANDQIINKNTNNDEINNFNIVHSGSFGRIYRKSSREMINEQPYATQRPKSLVNGISSFRYQNIEFDNQSKNQGEQSAISRTIS